MTTSCGRHHHVSVTLPSGHSVTKFTFNTNLGICGFGLKFSVIPFRTNDLKCGMAFDAGLGSFNIGWI